MTTRQLFLGVDGGGTKTEFLCIDEAGAAVASARTGTTYHLQVGLEGAIAALEEGVEAICRDLAIGTDAFDFCFFGLPAYGEDRVIDPLLHEACGRILGHDRFRCGNDMICGWAGSLGGEDGINLVAGTGSIGYGERQGRGARVGGWGEIFSDEGSAYWIAVQGLNAFSRMSDGRSPPGPLHHLFREALGLEDDLDLCARIMGENGFGRDGIAALAPIVVCAADEGDALAADILDRAASELAEMAVALSRNLGFGVDEPVRLSWSGGVLAYGGRVRDALVRRLQGAGRFLPVEPMHSPAEGAAIYAARLAERR